MRTWTSSLAGVTLEDSLVRRPVARQEMIANGPWASLFLEKDPTRTHQAFSQPLARLRRPPKLQVTASLETRNIVRAAGQLSIGLWQLWWSLWKVSVKDHQSRPVERKVEKLVYLSILLSDVEKRVRAAAEGDFVKHESEQCQFLPSHFFW